MSTRLSKISVFLVFAVQLGAFSFVALHRFVDGDEGFYTLASRLVMLHRTPYFDFFYSQTPLLPYVYAAFLKCFGASWTTARLTAAFLTALLGALVYIDIAEQTRKLSIALVGAITFTTSTFIFAWFPIAKTYSLSILFVFASYLLVSRASAHTSFVRIAWAGLFLGLAVDTRSYLIVVGPVLGLWIWRNAETIRRTAALRRFGYGFAIGILPALILFLASPGVFLFNNLGYHAIRSHEGFVGLWGQKLFLIPMMLLIRTSGNALQNSILLVASCVFVLMAVKRGSPPRLALQIAITLAVVSLLPTPAYTQYFAVCIPFLIVSAIPAVTAFISTLASERQRMLGYVAVAMVTLVFVAASIGDFKRFLVTGDGVPGAEWAYDRSDWKLDRIREVSRAVDEVAKPGEIVASFAPEYLFQTQAAPLVGLESGYGLAVSEKLTSEQRARYHIMSPAEAQADFASRSPRIVVLRSQSSASSNVEDWQNLATMEDSLRHLLTNAGYKLYKTIGDASIYVMPT